MPLSTIQEGDVTTINGTEITLVTDITARVYGAKFNFHNLIAAEVCVVRIYDKVRLLGDLLGSVDYVAAELSFTGAWADPSPLAVQYTQAVPCQYSCRVTLKMTAGLARVVPWTLLAYS